MDLGDRSQSRRRDRDLPGRNRKPKGSRSKDTWDPQIEAFELSGLLPTGMSFPLDFGMIPAMLADDGDPLDILVTGDEPAAVGCVVDVRILGVIKAEQTERGRTYRNDRLVGRVALSVSYEHARHIDDLGPPSVEHLGRWLTSYNALKGKGFEVIEIGDCREAIEIVTRAAVPGRSWGEFNPKAERPFSDALRKVIDQGGRSISTMLCSQT